MRAAATLLLLATLTACMDTDYGSEEAIDIGGHGLVIVNEGNFQYSNATLSHYDPATRAVENELFYRANAAKLGDVAESMTIHGGRAWVVVNNSHVLFALDPRTYRESGRVEGLTSPRHICFVDDRKAYVSQLWDNRIAIIDPATMQLTGHITVPGMSPASGSTEQMALIGHYVYATCWSYQDRLIRIDTRTDSVTASLRVGIQPGPLALDRHGQLWTVTDGGYAGSPYGHERARLHRIDPQTMTVSQSYELPEGESAHSLTLNATADTLYYIAGSVYRMACTDTTLPATPVLPYRGTRYYALTLDPDNGDLYIADAIDYQQRGMVRRYDRTLAPVDSFYVGVNPGAFCWQ